MCSVALTLRGVNAKCTPKKLILLSLKENGKTYFDFKWQQNFCSLYVSHRNSPMCSHSDKCVLKYVCVGGAEVKC